MHGLIRHKADTKDKRTQIHELTAGHTRVLVILDAGIQDGVGDLVADLVWVHR